MRLHSINAVAVAQHGETEENVEGYEATVLQAAADGIKAELDVYRQTPERRFFSLFGVPVTPVFVSVSTLVLTSDAGEIFSPAPCCGRS